MFWPEPQTLICGFIIFLYSNQIDIKKNKPLMIFLLSFYFVSKMFCSLNITYKMSITVSYNISFFENTLPMQPFASIE